MSEPMISGVNTIRSLRRCGVTDAMMGGVADPGARGGRVAGTVSEGAMTAVAWAVWTRCTGLGAVEAPADGGGAERISTRDTLPSRPLTAWYSTVTAAPM